MLQVFGASMFFVAALLHLLIIYLVSQPSQRAVYMGLAAQTKTNGR